MMNVKNKILSVALSASVIFYAGTASAAHELNQSVSPVVLEISDTNLPIDELVNVEYLESPAIERFNIAESIEEITPSDKDNSNQSATQNTSYSENDLYWLSRIIEAEASGESFNGKIAVGNCVLNRVKSSEFPNTIKIMVCNISLLQTA